MVFLLILVHFALATVWSQELPPSSRADQVSEEELLNEALLPRIDTKYRAGGYL